MYAYIIPYNIINIKYKFYCVYYYYYPYYHVFHVTQETKLIVYFYTQFYCDTHYNLIIYNKEAEEIKHECGRIKILR